MKRRPPLTYSQLDALVRKLEKGKGKYDAAVAAKFRAERDAMALGHTRKLARLMKDLKMPTNPIRQNGRCE